MNEYNACLTHSGSINDVRKSDTGGKDGRGICGGASWGGKGVGASWNSAAWARLASDFLLEVQSHRPKAERWGKQRCR